MKVHEIWVCCCASPPPPGRPQEDDRRRPRGARVGRGVRGYTVVCMSIPYQPTTFVRWMGTSQSVSGYSQIRDPLVSMYQALFPPLTSCGDNNSIDFTW